MVTVARHLVDLPAPVPPRYNLVASAQVVDEADPHWAMGVAARAYPDGEAVAWSYEVGSTVTEKPAPDFDRILSAKAFSVVWTYGCTRAGIETEEAFRARATAAYAAFETKVVEMQLWANPLGVDAPSLDSDNDPGGGDSLTVLNGGTAVKPILGIALLEQHAAESTPGAMIHARPGLVALLGGMYETAGPNTIATKLGTPIVSGAGYPGTGKDGLAITGQNEWAFVSGPVVIRRSGVDVLEALDRSVNDWVVTVEREYLVIFDIALQAAVKIDKALA